MSRAFICLRRNDVPQGLLFLQDLQPNPSYRDLIHDPQPQAGYLNPTNSIQTETALDTTATTTAGYPDVDPNGVGGDSHRATGAAKKGLIAYLQDVIHANPGGTDTVPTIAQATNAANDIIDRVNDGLSLTLTAINTILVNRCGADTNLDGDGLGDSFGTVEEVLRIVAGEVYKVPANTVAITGTGGGTNVFTALADRVAAIGANTANFNSRGSFVASTDSDYRPYRRLFQSDSLLISVGDPNGVLYKLKQATWTFTNGNFYYGGVAVAGKTAATDVGSTPGNIPATGAGAAIVVYDNLGNVL
jgi:hypothetical protein